MKSIFYTKPFYTLCIQCGIAGQTIIYFSLYHNVYVYTILLCHAGVQNSISHYIYHSNVPYVKKQYDVLMTLFSLIEMCVFSYTFTTCLRQALLIEST